MKTIPRARSKHPTPGTNGHTPTVEVVIVTPFPPMSSNEQADLATSEAVIDTRLKAFFEVGEALMKIRELKLYRSRFQTFEEYCRTRWDFSRIHANRLLHATEVRSKLIPLNATILPENERQTRPLIGLSPKLAGKAWLKALELAAGGKVTGSIVLKAVHSISNGKAATEAKASMEESWQKNIAPLLKKAYHSCKKGDRDNLTDLMHRMNLLLDIGASPRPKEERGD
jgi:hypothetical protein